MGTVISLRLKFAKVRDLDTQFLFLIGLRCLIPIGGSLSLSLKISAVVIAVHWNRIRGVHEVIPEITLSSFIIQAVCSWSRNIPINAAHDGTGISTQVIHIQELIYGQSLPVNLQSY